MASGVDLQAREAPVGHSKTWRNVMRSQNLHALVICGGIAGPALALLLKKARMSSVVYEAHGGLEDAGGGFTIAPDGMNVLQEVGLGDSVVEAVRGCRSSAFATRMARYWRAIERGM